MIIDLVIASIGHHGKDKGALRIKVQIGTDVSAHALVPIDHPVIEKIVHTVDAQSIGRINGDAAFSLLRGHHFPDRFFLQQTDTVEFAAVEQEHAGKGPGRLSRDCLQ